MTDVPDNNILSQLKLPLPTNSYAAIRCCLFQATRRPTAGGQSGPIQTHWGFSLVSQKPLGQQHADVLEALLFSAEHARVDVDTAGLKRLSIIVDLYQVRKQCRQEKNGSTFSGTLSDLEGVIIQIETDKIKIKGCIIERTVESKVVKDNPLGGGKRYARQITFGADFTSLLSVDLVARQSPYRIAKLQYGVSQAVARHVLTHRTSPPAGWTLNYLFKAVNATGRERENRAKLISDASELADLGVLIHLDTATGEYRIHKNNHNRL